MPSCPFESWKPQKNKFNKLTKLNLCRQNWWCQNQIRVRSVYPKTKNQSTCLDLNHSEKNLQVRRRNIVLSGGDINHVNNVQKIENVKLFIIYFLSVDDSIAISKNCYVKCFIVLYLFIRLFHLNFADYSQQEVISHIIRFIRKCKIKKVMEVDETKQEVTPVNNHVENKDSKILDLSLPQEKDENGFSTVINDNVNESKISQMKNSVVYVDKITTNDVDSKKIDGMVASGDLVSNCVGENGTNSIGDLIEGSQTETKLLVNNIKSEPVEDSNNELVEKKAIISDNLSKDEDVKPSEVKIKDENLGKDKIKDSHNGSSSSGHTSSNSDRKHDSYSRSHHSSSSSLSSRHRSKDDKHRSSSSTNK